MKQLGIEAKKKLNKFLRRKDQNRFALNNRLTFGIYEPNELLEYKSI